VIPKCGNILKWNQQQEFLRRFPVASKCVVGSYLSFLDTLFLLPSHGEDQPLPPNPSWECHRSPILTGLRRKGIGCDLVVEVGSTRDKKMSIQSSWFRFLRLSSLFRFLSNPQIRKTSAPEHIIILKL